MKKNIKEKYFNDKKQHLSIPLKEIVPEYYSNNLFIKLLFEKRQNIALMYISKINPYILLDIGCGDGSLIRKIKKKNKMIKTFGIDINPNVIKLNSIFKEKIFSKQDLNKLSFKRNSFDTITCLDVLEHIKDLNSALSKIKSVIKENGFLITSEPTENLLYKSLRFIYKGTFSQESGPTAGAHYWNANQIDKFIRLHGFKRIHNKKIPISFPFLTLFHVNLYKKIKKVNK
jgi:2-polyprenyl-3-methyl-5-hydroxy-6-metoxy-1,4-benzoquinol methylase